MKSEKNKKRVYTLVLVIIVICSLVMAGIGLKNMSAKLALATAMISPPLAVKTLEVRYGTAIKTVPALAQVKSAATIQIKSESGGTVLQLNYREGDRVLAGMQLALIDSREQDAQLQAAVARKESAFSQVNAMHGTLAALLSQQDSLTINLKYWEKELARGEKLFQAKAFTQSALDNIRNRTAEAKSKLTGLMAQIDSQRAQINSVESQKKAAINDVQVWKVRRDYAEVMAPLDCVISARLQEPGNRVAPGTPIYNVEDLSGIRLIMQVPQDSAAFVKIGQKIVLQNGEDSGFVVNRIFPVLNEFQQVTVEAAKIGDNNGVVLDMLIPIRIVVEETAGIIVPPEARFVDFTNQSRFFVFVVNESIATRQSLQSVLQGDDGIAVVSVTDLPRQTTLAVGPYLENVRLPASFAVEVMK